MGSGSHTSSVKVYAMSRWPTRSIGASFIAIGLVGFAASGGVLPLIVFGAMGALMLFAGERTEVQISPHGVKAVPSFGRARSYPWSDIDAFVAQRISGGYGAWVVSMSVGGELVALT